MKKAIDVIFAMFPAFIYGGAILRYGWPTDETGIHAIAAVTLGTAALVASSLDTRGWKDVVDLQAKKHAEFVEWAGPVIENLGRTRSMLHDELCVMRRFAPAEEALASAVRVREAISREDVSVNCANFHAEKVSDTCPYCAVRYLARALERVQPHAPELTPALMLLANEARERERQGRAARKKT